MSHFATAWAIKQRGLKPATKIVLFYLADRHNPDFGCFPSHKTLADDCEMSERSVRDHLEILEARDLISREKCYARGQFRSTRYILAFEDDFIPSAKSAVGENASIPTANFAADRRQDLPTNLVREPCNKPTTGESAADTSKKQQVVTSAFYKDLLQALRVEPKGWWAEKKGMAHVAKWFAKGLTEAQILDVARKNAQTYPEPPEGPKGLDDALAALCSASLPVGPARTEAEILAQWAEWLNSDAYIAPNSLSMSRARDLIALKLVTPENLKRRGIAY